LGLGRIEEAEGLAERLALLVLERLGPDGRAVGGRAVGGRAVDGRAVVLDRGVGGVVEAVAVGRVSPGFCGVGVVAGLNVATDSIAPATRHTARMLASSGRTDPRPAKGPASRRSRFRRRFARSSRW
jgi:hypothetical protein